MNDAKLFFQRGWIKFEQDRHIAEWVQAARKIADSLQADPMQRARWLRHGGTWFAGVNALPNAADGSISGVPLHGVPVAFLGEVLGLKRFRWDRAQISVCYPGYPQRDQEESEVNARYRRDRDAAHVDGLLRREPGRRRHLGELHGFILGLPLTETPPGAAPFVIYEGSHDLMRAAFRKRFVGIAETAWSAEDVTDTYVETRRLVFAECPRVEIHARPGESYIAHRLSVHGVAPWTAPPGPGRAIAYFRPDPMPGEPPGRWLDAP